MTEKRFEIYCDDNIIDNITKKTYHAYDDYTANELVELLNNFNDENEQLKQYINYIHTLYEDTHGINMENEEWWEDE